MSEEHTQPFGDLTDEIDVKGRYWTSPVVDATLRREFAAEQQYAAAVQLSLLMGEDPAGDVEASDFATCRLMMAALKVAERDLTKLALWVEVARNDPRDLIAAAEYPRQLHGEDGEPAIADLEEYVAWVVGPAE